MSLKTRFSRIVGTETYKQVVRVHMKSGKVIQIPCDKFDMDVSSDGLVSGYTASGVMPGALNYLNLNEVEAISTSHYNRFKRYV